MKFAGGYGIVVGLMMIVQWGFFLAAGQVPEVNTEPVRLAFHLGAEFGTAIALLASGVALVRSRRWGLNIYLVAAGMLLYSVIVSPGYFAQQGQWALVGMFGILLLLALASIRSILRAKTAEQA